MHKCAALIKEKNISICYNILTVFIVNAPMPFQCKSVSECSGTNVTLEGLLPGMHLGVVFQMGRLTERRSAGFASILEVLFNPNV